MKSNDLEKFKRCLKSFGFIIPKDAEFYKTEKNGIGMKVGHYVHSCHVDTTDIYVLLHIDEDGKTKVKEYWY